MKVGTAGVQPAVRRAVERLVLRPLPVQAVKGTPAPRLRPGRVLPHDRLQHPLALYDQLLEVTA